MAEIAPIHSAVRTTGFATAQQSGAFKGTPVAVIGIVQSNNSAANFDLRSINSANILMARQTGLPRKGIKYDQAEDIHKTVTKSAAGHLGDLTSLDIQSLHAAIKEFQKRKNFTSSDLRNLLEEHFEDPSLQHGALLAIANIENQMGETDGLKEMLLDLAHTLMEEQGPAIRAGYNINPVITLFADGELETFQTLREAYRATLLSDMDEGEIYNFLVHVLPSRLRQLLRKQKKGDKQKKKTKPAWEELEEKGEDQNQKDMVF